MTFSSHDKYGDNTRVGVIAQDVEKAYDGLNVTNAVMELAVESATDFEEKSVYDEDGNVTEIEKIGLGTSTKYGNIKKVRVETLVPLLIEAVKELSAKVTALENA